MTSVVTPHAASEVNHAGKGHWQRHFGQAVRHIGLVGGDADNRVRLHRAGADAGSHRCAGRGGCSHANRHGDVHGYSDAATHANRDQASTNCNADALADRHPGANLHAAAQADCYADSNSDPHATTNQHPAPNLFAHAYGVANAPAYPRANAPTARAEPIKR